MANGAIVQARIDPQIKEDARGVLDELGMSMSEAIGIYLRQIVLRRAIPFELKLPNKATLQAIRELEEGKGAKFATVKEFFKELDE
ncbi:MAG: hypothetical protein A2168_02280 [Planctomycetes bacterium RBG_13_50_24]|jgi:DNA-damage-inducible protein J|nr:MAG: hypothetical protein A2168_02280 [Planctomycetes bacterium RBG_13_50_24]